MSLKIAKQLTGPQVRSVRCGIIPYTFSGGRLHFLLGRDKTTGELGDFGGGVKKDEWLLTGGLREFIQETKGIFGGLYNSINQLTNKLALYSPQMTIIFVPVLSDWLEKAPALFKSRVSSDRHSNEMSELVWLDDRSFHYHVTSRSSRMMWKKVKTFLQDNYIPKKDLGFWLRHVYLS